MALGFKSSFPFNDYTLEKMVLRVKFGNLVRKRPIVVKREANVLFSSCADSVI
jgi:hypothetical protein